MTTDTRAAWHYSRCPLDDCRNRGTACDGCVWAEEALAPSGYLPRGTKKHPLIVAEQQARTAARRVARQSEASRRGRASRQKGARVERAFAKVTGGQRVPMSGALRGSLTNDVALPDGLRVEVKARANGAGFKQIMNWLFDEVEKPDALVLKADGKPWIIVQEYSQWAAGRQAVAIDLAKLGEALRLLNEALEREEH